MQNALVIGGAGFLGAALASELKNRGVSVRAFDNCVRGQRSACPHPGR